MFGICVVLSLLITAIIWNAGTWYLGLPASSSHTLIGSIFEEMREMFLPGLPDRLLGDFLGG